jgi:predicted ATP-grasp superfamily ATP-dependent carboligase
MQRIKNKAIVLELGVNGLGVTRSLAVQGIEVIGVYTVDGLGVYSKYCTPIKFPPIEYEIKFLAELLRRCEFEPVPPVLFPTSDKYVRFISNYRDILNKVALFNIPDQKLLKTILSKKGVQELAQEHQVNSPNTYQLICQEELESLLQQIKFPCVFKPTDHRLVLLNGLKCYVFNKERDLVNFVKTTEHELSLGVFQELVFSGDEYSFSCSGYLNQQFQMQSIFCAKKLRQYPPDFGIMCYGESTKNKKLLDISEKFLLDIKFKGIFDIDFLQDRNSLEYFLIEINPRPFYYNSFSTSCGVNVVFQMYQDLVMKGCEPVLFKGYKEGIRWIDFEFDIGSVFRKYRIGNIRFLEWIKSLLKVRACSVFDTHDVRPFIVSVWRLVGKTIKKIL